MFSSSISDLTPASLMTATLLRPWSRPQFETVIVAKSGGYSMVLHKNVVLLQAGEVFLTVKPTHGPRHRSEVVLSDPVEIAACGLAPGHWTIRCKDPTYLVDLDQDAIEVIGTPSSSLVTQVCRAAVHEQDGKLWEAKYRKPKVLMNVTAGGTV